MIHFSSLDKLPRGGLDYYSCSDCVHAGFLWKLSPTDRLYLVKLMAKERGAITAHIHGTGSGEWRVARCRIGTGVWTTDFIENNFEDALVRIRRLVNTT